MERAAILDVYDYIGYSLCHALLEKGIEIEGIHFGNKTEHYFTEEKRLDIGRNANFSERDFQEWDASDSGSLLIISLFEAYQKNDSRNGHLADEIIGKLDDVKEASIRIMLILPASLATMQTDIEQKMTVFFEKKKFPVLGFYLPTIFGPWQPEESFFQQALNHIGGGGDIPIISEWEWIHDALYIEDAVNLIVKMAEGKQEGKFILKSGLDRHWLNCAEHLLGSKLEQSLRKAEGKPVIKDSIQEMEVQGNEDISYGLSKQMDHFCRIQDRRV